MTPAVNQIEWSPLLYDADDARRRTATRGIVLEGYSALRGGTLDHPAIVGDRRAARVVRRPR